MGESLILSEHYFKNLHIIRTKDADFVDIFCASELLCSSIYSENSFNPLNLFVGVETQVVVDVFVVTSGEKTDGNY